MLHCSWCALDCNPSFIRCQVIYTQDFLLLDSNLCLSNIDGVKNEKSK